MYHAYTPRQSAQAGLRASITTKMQFAPRVISAAVWLAISALPTTAGAIGCNQWGNNVITGTFSGSCSLASGSSLEVTAPNGLISLTSEGAAVSIVATVGAASVTNAGTISGILNAISVSGTNAGNTITNTGTINGAVALGKATLNLNGNAGTLNGAVSGKGSRVNVNGLFTSGGSFDVDTFAIADGGVFTMGHAVSTTSGLTNAGKLAIAAGTTASVTGNYTQATTGILETGLSSAINYGKLAVSGTADFSASGKINVNVVGAPSLAAGNALSGVITAATLTPNAAGFTVTDNSSLFNFVASTSTVGPNQSVALTVVAAPASSNVVSSVGNANNPAGQGAAQVFDNLIAQGNTAPAAMGATITALGTLPTGQAVSNAVSQTLPLMTGGMTGLNASGLHTGNGVIQARLDANGQSSGDGFVTDRQFWVKPVGSWATQDDRNGVSGYKADTYGLLLGADQVLSSQLRAGAALSYMHSTVDSNSSSAPQQAKVDGYRAIAYGSYSLDPRTELSFQADLGSSANKGQRTINFGGLSSVASSDYNSWSAHLGAGLGRTYDLSAKTRFTPSIRADYTQMRDAAYTETGAGALNLAVVKNTTKELILAVDGKWAYALSNNKTLTANLGAGYDTLAKQSAITAAFVGGGGQFTTRGINPSPWLVRAGLGMKLNTSQAVEISARYDVEIRNSFSNQTASIKVRMPF
jgi:autotransporter family porin